VTATFHGLPPSPPVSFTGRFSGGATNFTAITFTLTRLTTIGLDAPNGDAVDLYNGSTVMLYYHPPYPGADVGDLGPGTYHLWVKAKGAWQVLVDLNFDGGPTTRSRFDFTIAKPAQLRVATPTHCSSSGCARTPWRVYRDGADWLNGEGTKVFSIGAGTYHLAIATASHWHVTVE
jgi:hypothetical protein